MIFKSINKNEFLKNTAILVSGTTLAQIVPFILYPVLGRIFTPEDFGVLSLITAIASVISVIATGQYQSALLIAKSKKSSINILALSVIVSFLICVISLIILYFFRSQLAVWLSESKLTEIYYLCPVMAFSIVIYSIYNEWCVKREYFKNLSCNKIFNAFAVTFPKWPLGQYSIANGLLWGEVIGRILSALLCVFSFLRRDFLDLRLISKKEIISMSKKYREFPLYVMPGRLLNTLGQQVPIIIISSFFSSEELGFYSMAMTVICLPVSMIGIAVKDAFRKKANDYYQAYGNCYDFYKKTALYLTVLSLTGFSLFYMMAPWLFVLVLGDQWIEAGYYAQSLTPMIAICFVSDVLSAMFVIAEKMKQLMWWQILFVSISILSFLIGAIVFNSMTISLYIFMITRSMVYLYSMFLTYRYAK